MALLTTKWRNRLEDSQPSATEGVRHPAGDLRPAGRLASTASRSNSGVSRGRRLRRTTSDLPAWVLGLATAGIVLVAYGLLGLAGYWIARRGLAYRASTG